MPFTTILPELERALAQKRGVALFDVFDSLSIDGLTLALEESGAAAIVAIYSGTFDQPNGPALADYARRRMEHLPQPVSLMLDHGSSPEQCQRAVDLGYTDVMFDGSKLSYEENMAATRKVTEYAHRAGVHVEAELGHVGMGSEYPTFGARRQGFTDPAAAEAFVRETKVDILAVAIGTAHGMYAGDPHLDLELLSDIRRRVPQPLALHGGSGLSEEQFRAAIHAGISKINVATELIITAGKRMCETAAAEKNGYFNLTSTAVNSYRERCLYYLRLFIG